MTTTEGAREQPIPVVSRQSGETESFVGRLKRETVKAVDNLGRVMMEQGLGETVVNLRKGRQEGDGVMGAARLMYELSRKWMRQDYRGFVTWLKQEGVPQEQVRVYVEALNAEGDRERMGQIILDLATLLKSESGVGQPMEGEKELLLMAEDVGAAGTAKGGGDETPPEGFDFPSGPEWKPPHEEKGKKEPREEEKTPPRQAEELALPGRPTSWGRQRRREGIVKPVADKPLKTTLGRRAAIGCLLVALGTCCALTTPVVSWVGVGLRPAAGAVAEELGYGPMAADRGVAERMANRIFGEDGGDPNHVYIDRFLGNYESAVRGGSEDLQRVYEEAMTEELKQQGIITDEQGRKEVDNEEMRLRLRGYGYSEEDIEALLGWSVVIR